MSLVEFFSQPVWHRLALTLVHFLWQGLAVAVIACAAARAMRLKRGNPRYAAYLLAFAAMTASPLLTFAILGGSAKPTALAPGPLPALESSAFIPRSGSAEPPQQRRESAPIVGPRHEVPLRERLDHTLQASLPWALVGWMGGVLVLSVRLLLGFLGVRRWRRHAEPLAEDLEARMARLSERLGLPGFARVFTSRHAREVVALGYLRPMVLLPAAFATQMPPEMLEAVIAHELAHIRRLDLWVNLAQRVVETLLFYHPAVWWLSSRLRSERELCCDELAVKATGERLTYASALERAGRVRLAIRQPVLALGLGQGRRSTLGRVRHVLGLPPTSPDSRFWLAGVIAVVLLAGLATPAVTVLTAEAKTQRADQTVAQASANGEKPEQPRYAARTFNSKLGLDVFVQRTDADDRKLVGRTPSAAPIEIPACWLWLVQPTAPVKDWDLLVKEMTQNGVPGLHLAQATDSDLRLLTGLTGLQFLDLSNSPVTDAGLAYLKGVTGLETLELPGNRITNAGLVHLEGLTRLRRLDLSNTGITDEGLGMAWLTDLTGLPGRPWPEGTVTDAAPVTFEGMTGPQWLYLSDTQVIGRDPTHLDTLTQFQGLPAYSDTSPFGRLAGFPPFHWSGTPVPGAGLGSLKGLTRLRDLRLRDVHITDASVEHLRVLTGLEYLDLRGTQITEAGFRQLKQSIRSRIEVN